jgi:hypothetical protein
MSFTTATLQLLDVVGPEFQPPPPDTRTASPLKGRDSSTSVARSLNPTVPPRRPSSGLGLDAGGSGSQSPSGGAALSPRSSGVQTPGLGASSRSSLTAGSQSAGSRRKTRVAGVLGTGEEIQDLFQQFKEPGEDPDLNDFVVVEESPNLPPRKPFRGSMHFGGEVPGAPSRPRSSVGPTTPGNPALDVNSYLKTTTKPVSTWRRYDFSCTLFPPPLFPPPHLLIFSGPLSLKWRLRGAK